MQRIAALTAAALCAIGQARILSKTANATSSDGATATSTGVASWTPAAANAAKAPNDLASFWVDYAIQVEALGYVIAANKRGEQPKSDDDDSGDDEDDGAKDGIDVEGTVEALIAPMREYQDAQNGGSATPADLKRTAKALMAMLASDASFDGDNLNEDAFDGTEVDPDVVAPETLLAAVTARNAVFAAMPSDQAANVRSSYAKMLAKYAKALDMSVRSKYARVFAPAAIDWAEYGRQYAEVAAKAVAKDPARMGPAAREYFAAWLHTGEPDKAAYDALIAGRAGGPRPSVFAAVSSMVPDGPLSGRSATATKGETAPTDAAFVDRCRRAKAVVCDCNSAAAVVLAGSAAVAVLLSSAVLL